MNQILIVEDEERLAAFVQKGLKKNGFNTAVAANGEQAIALTQSSTFDLILLDLNIPIKDGLTVLKELRNNGQHLPIIVVTALTDERDKKAAFKAGANDYINKPFSFQDLLARVRVQLS
ncbi:hypothetical protein NUACC21_27320 [Scytonema sp. NUACC21]